MRIATIALLLLLVGSCHRPADHAAPAPSPVADAGPTSEMPPSGNVEQSQKGVQSIPCTIRARVISLERIDPPLPPKDQLKGYLIDDEPQWELKLDVLPHDQKIPFQPGPRTCFIADVAAVFHVPPDQVQGEYEISFVWNVNVPGKPEFESFQAKK